jgi:ketosteroid isomerase-like protein
MGNADVVRSFYGAMESGDLPTALGLITPDCTWAEMDGLAPGGTYTGPEGIRDGVFVPIVSQWDGFRLSVDEVLDAGAAVVSVGTYSGTSKQTGKDFEARVVHVFRVENGQITAFEQFTDTARIAAAKGG